MAPASFSVLALALVCSTFLPGGSAGSSRLVPMQKYQVDLDMKPSQRWLPILEDFRSSVPLILDYFYSAVRLHGKLLSKLKEIGVL